MQYKIFHTIEMVNMRPTHACVLYISDSRICRNVEHTSVDGDSSFLYPIILIISIILMKHQRKFQNILLRYILLIMVRVVEELLSKVNRCLYDIRSWMITNKLKMNNIRISTTKV